MNFINLNLIVMGDFKNLFPCEHLLNLVNILLTAFFNMWISINFRNEKT